MHEKILSSYTFPDKPSSDGYWHIYVKDPDKKGGRRSIKKKSLDDLRQAVLEHEQEQQKIMFPSFADVFEQAIEDKLKYIKDPEKLASAVNTARKDRYDYNRFYADNDFASMRVIDITPKNIEDFCFSALSQFDLKAKAFAGLKHILSLVFNYSMYEEYIPENPMSRVRFKRFKDMLVPETPVKDRSYSDEDIERIMDYIHDYQKEHPYFMPAFSLELQLLCCFRSGELPPLEWSDINPEGYIEISKEEILSREYGEKTGRNVIVHHTKTYMDRRYPVTTKIQEFLDKLKEIQKIFYPGSRFLFPDNSTELGIIKSTATYNFFYKHVCKDLGIKMSSDFIKGTHAFRRNGITKVANSDGGGLMMASQLFGNSPNVAKKNYYTGLDMEKARAILEG